MATAGAGPREGTPLPVISKAGSARPREGTPPPVISKAGRYTVFITPPATPKTASSPSPRPQTPSSSLRPAPLDSPSPSPSPTSPATPTPAKAPPFPALTPVHPSSNHSPRSLAAPAPVKASPSTAAVAPPPPTVQVPPPQFSKPGSRSSNSTFGFFWDAVDKVQNAHSRLDECIAEWFGLDQSKYQWALNDYYESKGMDKEAGKTKNFVTKNQSV